jgi:hypothetical protein
MIGKARDRTPGCDTGMREEGLEPSRLAAQEPKSCVSAVPPLSRSVLPWEATETGLSYPTPPDWSIEALKSASDFPSPENPIAGRLRRATLDRGRVIRWTDGANSASSGWMR